MQFHIPQFIEVEDKIFGPFTFKQFIYILGGAGASFFFYSVFPTKIISIPLIVLFGGFSLLLAFHQINGRPFAVILEAGIQYFFGDKLYLWRQNQTKKPVPQKKSPEIQTPTLSETGIPRVVSGKLDTLSWKLDTKSE